MARWQHKTKTGRVVYDRPKNHFRVSDAKRVLVGLEKPWVVLPQHAWKALFRDDFALVAGVQGWFHDFLRESVPSRYIMEGSVLPHMGHPSQWPDTWRQDVCENIISHQQVTLVRNVAIG